MENSAGMVVALVVLILVNDGSGRAVAQQRQEASRLQPTHADVSYGPHQRNVLDLYLAPSESPTPLALYIHGGGFRGGDKRSLNPLEGKSYLDAGYSIAAVNYRLTDAAPMPAAYLDCARALQFLRHHAQKWNLDPRLVASTGGSAGAGTSMWLAFHDDLANPKADDPVARESTRLTCIAVRNGQSSYDPRFAESIGIPRPNFERHPFFLPFYGIEEHQIESPQAYELYQQAAPVTYVSKDDPPALLMYSYPNEEVGQDSPLGLIVHHPKFGIALKKRLDELKIECVVQYPERRGGKMLVHGEDAQPVQAVDFIRKHFERAKANVGVGNANVPEVLSAPDDEPRESRQGQQSVPPHRVAQLLEQLDKDNDGVLDKGELPAALARRLIPLDVNRDGKLTATELQEMKAIALRTRV